MDLLRRAINSVDGKSSDTHGSLKECFYVLLDDKEYALLVYKCGSDKIERNNLRISETKKLIAKGLKTPNIIDILYENEYAYELQEKVQGDILIGRSIPFEDNENFDSYYLSVLKNLQIMEKSPNECLIELLENAALLYSNSYSIDCHADNFIIDNFGNITFIDIDIFEPLINRDIKKHYCINVLPNILSTMTYYISPNNKYYIPLKEILTSLAAKWIEVCNIYLTKYGYTKDEIKEVTSKIQYSYFLQNNDEKNELLNNYYGININL